MSYNLAVAAACCCTEPVDCSIWSDNFGSDDLDQYDQVSGTPIILFGQLAFDDSNSRLDGLTTNPTNANTRITANVTIGSGDTARFYLDDGDWYGELKAGTGAYLRIYQGATLRASCSPTIAAGTISVCASIVTAPGTSTQTFRFVLPGLKLGIAAGGTFTGQGWGIGTGTIVNPVVFDNLVVRITSEQCDDCTHDGCSDCDECDADSTPNTITLTISGGTGAYATINGTQILYQYNSVDTCFSTLDCDYYGLFFSDANLCGAGPYCWSLRLGTGGHLILHESCTSCSNLGTGVLDWSFTILGDCIATINETTLASGDATKGCTGTAPTIVLSA